MKNGQCSGNNLKFLELGCAVNCNIFDIVISEKCGSLLDSSPLLDERILSAYFLYLLRFEVLLDLKFGNLCEFFIDVSNLLLQGAQERFVLLVNDGLGRLLGLLGLFRHMIFNN